MLGTCRRMAKISIAGFILLASFPVSPENIARGKPALSSSHWLSHTPGKCVDDDSGSAPEDASWFTSRWGDELPWWAVDLQHIYTVRSVSVTLQRQSTATTFNFLIDLFELEVTLREPENHGKLCYKRSFAKKSGMKKFNFHCNPSANGRYLRIIKFKLEHNKDTLSMCDVTVQGHKGIEISESSKGNKDKGLRSDRRNPDKGKTKTYSFERNKSLFPCRQEYSKTERNDAKNGYCSCLCELT